MDISEQQDCNETVCGQVEVIVFFQLPFRLKRSFSTATMLDILNKITLDVDVDMSFPSFFIKFLVLLVSFSAEDVFLTSLNPAMYN